jgi:GrpE protein
MSTPGAGRGSMLPSLGVVVAGTVLTLIAVLWLAPTAPDARTMAGSVLDAAQSSSGRAPGVVEAVLRVLPDGADAVVWSPGLRSDRARTADGRVQVLPAGADRDGPLAQLAGTGAVTTGASGSWSVAVTVPAPGSRAPAALIATFLVAVTGLAAAALAPGRTEPTAQAPPPAPPPALQVAVLPSPVPAAPAVGERLRSQRDTLVTGLAELLPQLPEALAWQAANVLESVGIRPVVPDGDRFDPAVHRAVGTEPAPDSAAAETVARTVRPGYADDGRVLVPPRVVVYAADERSGHRGRA